MKRPKLSYSSSDTVLMHKLKTLCIEHKYSYRELGLESGLSFSTISYLADGTHTLASCNLTTKRKIVEFLKAENWQELDKPYVENSPRITVDPWLLAAQSFDDVKKAIAMFSDIEYIASCGRTGEQYILYRDDERTSLLERFTTNELLEEVGRRVKSEQEGTNNG